MSVLEARAVEQRFGGVRALAGVSLTVPTGEVVGLIGPNGSGKTTLLNVMSGVQQPTSGSVLVGERDATGWSSTRMCGAGVARTFQNIRLFGELTVQENVEVGLRDRRGRARVAAARELLERHGLMDLGQRAAGTLAYAQQRRVELVRALATKPRFLLLDEPAAGMNRAESEALLGTILALPKEHGIGVLVIDHDLYLITRVAARIAVLNEGSKLAEGTPQEVQQDERVIETYLGSGAGRSRTTKGDR